jgi:hypothetical protein
MAKKRPKPDPDDEGESGAGFPADRLGTLMSRYQVTLAGVLIFSGVVALVGLGLVGFALTRERTSIVFLLIGTVVLLLAFALVGVNVFNVGRRLEVRKRGIRFVEAGIETEMYWQDIADIRVNRTDDTDLGVVTVRKRGSHYAAPSGPLTRTEWEVTIRAHDGRTIYLRPTFLRIVPDVRKLVSQLRMRAGI